MDKNYFQLVILCLDVAMNTLLETPMDNATTSVSNIGSKQMLVLQQALCLDMVFKPHIITNIYRAVSRNNKYFYLFPSDWKISFF